jgi:hypothetical protein
MKHSEMRDEDLFNIGATNTMLFESAVIDLMVVYTYLHIYDKIMFSNFYFHFIFKPKCLFCIFGATLFIH